MARPTKYDPRYCDSMYEYFTRDYTIDEESTEETISAEDGKLGTKKRQSKKVSKKKIGSQLPTFAGWCFQEKITKQTMLNWTKEHGEFLDAYMMCKARQEDMLIQNTLSGKYNSGFAHFLAKNLTSMRDDPHNEMKGTEINITIDSDDAEM